MPVAQSQIAAQGSIIAADRGEVVIGFRAEKAQRRPGQIAVYRQLGDGAIAAADLDAAAGNAAIEGQAAVNLWESGIRQRHMIGLDGHGGIFRDG